MDRIMFVEKERNVDDVVQHPQKQSKEKPFERPSIYIEETRLNPINAS